jgi:hypothetical protein
LSSISKSIDQKHLKNGFMNAKEEGFDTKIK